MAYRTDNAEIPASRGSEGALRHREEWPGRALGPCMASRTKEPRCIVIELLQLRDWDQMCVRQLETIGPKGAI